jgi:tetratricopeptide (TPR) repeat protein
MKPVPRTSSVALLSIALIVIILAVYMQVGNHQFLNFDDEVYVTRNAHITSGITGKNIIWAFTSFDEANWHPITWLSHMTDVRFYGLSPRGHHLTNVAIHTVSSVLLLLLLFRLTGAPWQSSFVAFLFALHPLHVESVAWVAERKDVLSALFWFLTLLFYAEYVARRKPALYILALFSFVLGLMSKPMLVTLPVVMLLMDFWPLGRYQHAQRQGLRQYFGRATALVKEKIPFFLCSFTSGMVTIYAQHESGAVQGLNVLSYRFRIENALIAYVKYIAKTFWPRDLAAFYPYPLSIPLWQVICSLLLLFLLSVVAVRMRQRHPYLAVGWFWFLVTLVPVSGLLQVGSQSMADRYSYIPLVGLFIVAAWGGAELAKGLQHRQGILALLAGAAITASALLTWQQLGYWRDSISLYQHTLQVTTGNYVIHNHLGLALADKGELESAIQEYQKALLISPKFMEAHYNLGNALVSKGNPDAAIREYREALQISPDNPGLHYNLGNALDSKGEPDAAIREYRKALRINPNYTGALNNLGIDLAGKGDLDAAIREFLEVLRISPDDTGARNNLAIALARKKMHDEAGK